MQLLRDIGFLLHLTRGQRIARRYFVTNGFDGALTMLGLVMGFHVSGPVPPDVALGACVGTAVALGVSGLTSAYVSESAERRRALDELQAAMMADLGDSAHGRAARLVPILIALVNGAAPVLLSLVIISPLWLAALNVELPLDPIAATIGLAFVVLFLLGVFIGMVSRTFWLWAGLRTLLVAAGTALLIFLLGV
jgi:predicted membrane protein (TIGR00267 family)